MKKEINIFNTPPFLAIDKNMAISRTGDVVFCYGLDLPEKHSLNEEGYDNFLKEIAKSFKSFEKDTVIHKMDFYFDAQYKKDIKPRSWLEHKFYEHHSKKTFKKHLSFLFFTWTLSDIIGRDDLINPFKKLRNEKEIIKRISETHFIDTVKNTVAYVNQNKVEIRLKALNHQYIEGISRTYFNGLQQGILTDGERHNKTKFTIGDRIVDIFSINSLKQLPQKLTNVIEDEQISKQGKKFYQGITESFGFSIACDHIVNQIIYLPGHGKMVNEIQKRKEDFTGARGFGNNARPAKKIEKYLSKIEDDKNLRLCKSHFNVITFSENDKHREAVKEAVKSKFTANDMVPYLPNGNALNGLFINSFFAFSPQIPDRFKFINSLEQASSFFIPTTSYKDDKEGIQFCDRLFNKPLIRDVWDEQEKYIKARNFMVIAPTGQGKSLLCNHLAYQYIDQGYKLVINDLGKSYQNLYRLYKDRSVMLEFESGVPLGLNPFRIKDEERISSEEILYLNDIINLLHFKGNTVDVPSPHNVCLRKVIQGFYDLGTETNRNIETFYKFFQFIHANKRYEEIGVDTDQFDPYQSMGEVIFSLSEFGDPNGIYNFLFRQPKDDRKLFRITPDTDFAYFEFDKAGEDHLLQSLLQIYSYQATKSVIWEDKDVKGIMLYDEYAKQMKNPQVAATSEYLTQAIRKQNGASGLVIQSVNQVPKNDSISAILDNTSVFYILPNDKGHKATAERLEMEKHHHYLLDSLESNFVSDQPYSEVLLVTGKRANVVRVQLPKAHYYAFQTKGGLYNKMNDLYKKSGDMRLVIDEMTKLN